MKITCPSCSSKYAIADDKVRGRRVKVRCKSCGEPIIVDGSSGDQELEATRAEPVFSGQSSAPPSDIWSVNLSDTDQRSMTTNEIVDAFNQGMLGDAYVWKEGMGDWVPLASAPDLAPYLSAPQHSAPAQPAAFSSPFQVPERAAEPARVAARGSRGRGDLFGGIASAGSEEEAVAAASVPPSSSESRMTGQRNENSVLFSLDALKAGVDAAPQRAAPARGQSAAPKDDKASLDDIMSLGGGGSASPLFSMHANQALLAAPPPPPEPPPRPATPVDAIISSSVMPAPVAQKGGGKAIIAISAAIGLLAILGIVALLVLNKGDKDADKTAKTDSTEKSGDSKKAGDEKGTSGSSERSSGSETTNTGGSDPATAGSTGDPKAPVTEEEKKRFAEAMKKKEEEDKKNGTTDPKKEEEDAKKKETPSTGVASFDKGAAIAALSGAAAQASGCKRPGGPTGAGKAIVTFAPSGRVTSANVSGGDFGGSPVGSCVASVFRRASVPAFNGDPVTVSKSFRISP